MARDRVQVSGFSTSGLVALRRVYFRRRYTILFYSLLLTMIVAPLLTSMSLGTNLIELFLAINLIAAVIPDRKNPGANHS